MKSYTDIEQSKVLAEILPIESADMWWNFYSVTTDDTTPQIIHLDTPWVGSFNWNNEPDNIPCWSLTALLDVLPTGKVLLHDKGNRGYKCICNNIDTYYSNNPIDACCEMILKLKENNLL